MQFIAGLVLMIGALAFVYLRLRGAGGMGGGRDIRRQSRRVMHERNQGAHPADSITDPRLAAAGIVVVIASMDQPIRQAEIAALTQAARETFDVTDREALDIISFARWIGDQFDTSQEAVQCLATIVAAHAGPEAGPDLVRMITEVATADGTRLGEDETAAINIVRQTLSVD